MTAAFSRYTIADRIEALEETLVIDQLRDALGTGMGATNTSSRRRSFELEGAGGR